MKMIRVSEEAHRRIRIEAATRGGTIDQALDRLLERGAALAAVGGPESEPGLAGADGEAGERPSHTRQAPAPPARQVSSAPNYQRRPR